MNFLPNISAEEINLLEVRQFEGKIHLIDSQDDADEAAEYLSHFPVIGFDTETKPNFKKGSSNKVSLMQLAVEGEAFLFRLHYTGLPDSVIRLFESEDILFTGVAIRDDVRKLQQIRNFNPVGFLELQKYSGYFKIEDNSLKKLAAIVMNIRISKSQQLSDWEARVLTEAQMRYAATDAWVCLEIYRILRNTIIHE
ncbi:MAG: 3'-5' exonuclease domain-containing protein 2 [Bacteroidales bacterium]|nr:3'-5' exonuclease domain-containing protein 2 [Bacteroidales bacterium]